METDTTKFETNSLKSKCYENKMLRKQTSLIIIALIDSKIFWAQNALSTKYFEKKCFAKKCFEKALKTLWKCFQKPWIS